MTRHIIRDREAARMIKAAKAAGWTVTETLSPDGKTSVGMHKTPSDGWRANANRRADFRRAGLSV